MNTYRIMIVDDEADVREGIVSHIPWNNIGFEVAAEAENGKDALEKAEALQLDVVLTDIKMPFMDGLTMCRHLNELFPSIKIIILTGFDEFEYAKAAIQLNAVEYVLKPVNVAELTEVMQRIHHQLDKDIKNKRDIDILRQQYERALPLMRERFLTALLWGNTRGEDTDEQIAQYDIAPTNEAYHVVIAFEIEPEKTADKQPAYLEYAPLSVRQIVEEVLHGRCASEVLAGATSIIAITVWQQEAPISELAHISNEICLRCKRILELSVTAGIGRCHPSMHKIHTSFMEARAALEYKAIVGSGRAIYIQDMEQAEAITPGFDSYAEQQLLSVIKFGTYEQMQMQVTDMLKAIQASSLWEKQAYLLGVLNAFFRIIQTHDLHAESAITERIQALLHHPEDWSNIDEVNQILCNICTCMGEYINARRITTAKSIAAKAVHYIEQTYQDSQLSLEQLCQHLHVSQAYFSAIFKQEVGMSYVQYLTDTRMRHAIALLQETDDKTYTIAQKVGYDEPNYFSYVFKKRFGMSPTKYRNQGMVGL